MATTTSLTGSAAQHDSVPFKRSELEAFTGPQVERYAEALEEVARGENGPFNWIACLVGPLWAARRRIWMLFWPALVIELGAAAVIADSLAGGVTDAEGGGSAGGLVAGLALFVAGRALLGRLSYRGYWQLYLRWRQGRTPGGAPSLAGLTAGIAALIGFGGIAILHFGNLTAGELLETFPAEPRLERGISTAIDDIVDWMTVEFDAVFTAITIGIRELLDLLETVFIGTPWPILSGAIILLAWRFAGWKVSLFAALSLLYLGLFGYWEKSMSTLSLVGASAFVCVIIGGPLGILCGKRPRLYGAVRPVLDFMQVMPTFVYLIPAVAFFSIGKPPGVLATVVFAMPPMIRLTALGIQQVPFNVREAGTAFGCSQWQLLAKVELPLAVPSIMTGINQTIMMCLSMVIVASMIGAGGLGYDVLVALRHLKTGEGFLAGTAIVVCAMMLDRIIQGGGRSNRRERQDAGQ